MRYARHSMFASLFFVVAWLAACVDTPPALLDLPAVGAAKGGGKPLKVNEADPPYGDQGTVSLDVRVLGSGFDDGSPGPPQVTWLLDGDPTGVTTNSVAFGNDPDRELLTNITIAEDARLDLWDIEVTTRRGKKGMGMDRFEVRPGGGPPQAPDPSIVVFRDAASDNIRSDDEVRSDAEYSGPVYDDGVCGVSATVGNGDDGLLFPSSNYKRKLAKSCGDARVFVFEWDDPADGGATRPMTASGTLMNIGEVVTVADGATELRLGSFNVSVCNRLLFYPDDPFAPGNGSDLLQVTYDAASDSWTVETQPYPNDKAWCDNDGRLWHMPFRATITRK